MPATFSLKGQECNKALTEMGKGGKFYKLGVTGSRIYLSIVKMMEGGFWQKGGGC